MSDRASSAGHPPLVFDAAAFAESMPPHWEDESDLSFATWAAGRGEALRAHMENVARFARGDDAWPEYAVLDCYSCHHDILREPTMYARHEPPGRSGKPPLDEAYARLYDIASGAEDVARSVREAYRDGRARLIAKAAEDLARALEPARPDARRVRERLREELEAIRDDRIRAPRHFMQQLAFAVKALGAAPEAYAALDQALAAPYDPIRCAELALAALGE